MPPNCQYENSGGAPGGAASPLVTLKTVRSSTFVLMDCRLGGPVVPLVRICSATPGSGLGMPSVAVAALEAPHGCDGGRSHREGDPRAASPLCRRDDLVRPVLLVGHDRRQAQRLDVAADRLRRLERIDHRDGPACRDESHDGCGMWQPVAHHQPDRCIVGDPCGAQHRRDGVGVFGHLVAREPPALVLDALTVAVAGKSCREPFGKRFGHASTITKAM